jgi:hypothetical protein
MSPQWLQYPVTPENNTLKWVFGPLLERADALGQPQIEPSLTTRTNHG